MSGSIAIAKREILSFFVSPIAYFLITGYVVLGAYFFYALVSFYNNIVRQYQAMSFGGNTGNIPTLNTMVIEGFFQTLVVVLVFLIPLLTMRTIAEEKKRGTFELLVTSPISVFDIVFGKYMAIAFVIIIMHLLILGFPALLFIYLNDTPELYPTLTGILGLTLCALSFASLSMAVSCSTENQIVAAVSGMVLLLVLYVIQSYSEAAGGGVLTDLLNYLSPSVQLQDLMKGVISVKAIVYFLSSIGLGLFISQRALDSYRYR